MIRHYEKLGMVPEAARTAGRYRDYSEAEVARLRFIARARNLGVPLDEIGALLDGDEASRPRRARDWLILLDQKGGDLAELRAEIERMAEVPLAQV